MEKLLTVKNLKVSFTTDRGIFPAVRGLDFEVARGEVLGLVGESGCGKSVTVMSLLRILPNPSSIISADQITLGDTDLSSGDEHKLMKARGLKASYIFQEPMSALNPVLTVERQLSEAILLHEPQASSISDRVSDLLTQVGIASPRERMHSYPHELSGGMRQRVMIAMALSCNPELLIADEPTTALDVTVQAQILHLLKKLQTERKMAMIFITHDLSVIANIADRIAVMYAGRIVESAKTDVFFKNPKHPYSHALLGAIPHRGLAHKQRLMNIEGKAENTLATKQSCSFANRCPYKVSECDSVTPELIDSQDGRKVACHRQSEINFTSALKNQ